MRNLLCLTVAAAASKCLHAHEEKNLHTRYTPSQQYGRMVSTTTYSCPVGYYLEHETCIQKMALDFENACEAGTRATNEGFCAHSVDPVKKCEKELQDGMCVDHSTREPTVVCPPGYTLMDGKCALKLKYENMCSEGSVYVHEQTCAHKAPAKIMCPDGYAIHDDMCVKESQQKAMHKCPEGMGYVEKTNMCEFEMQNVPKCPSGSFLSNGSCVKRLDKIGVCPHDDGTHKHKSYDAHTCVVKETKKPIAVCHNGGSLENNKCKLKINIPLQPFCENGFSLINNVCERSVVSPAKMLCPNDYNLSGDVCVKNLAYDCSETIRDVVCEDRMQKKDTKGNTSSSDSYSGLRLLGRFAPRTDSHPNKHAHSHKQSQLLPVCKLQQEIVPKECNKTLHAQVEPVCGDSSYMGGGQCIDTEFQAPKYDCAESGTTVDCFVLEYQDPLFTCPDGYTPVGEETSTISSVNKHSHSHHHIFMSSHEKLQCVKESYVPKQFVCPPNSHGDMCEMAVNKPTCDNPNGSCATDVKREPVSYVCPVGYTYTTQTLIPSADAPYETKRSAHSKNGYKNKRMHKNKHTHKIAHANYHTRQKVVCTRVMYSVPETVCEDGYEKLDDFTCAKLHPTHKLQEAISIEPSYACEEGYVLNETNKRCSRKYEKMPESVCPTTYSLENDMCIKLFRPSQVCPYGSTYAKGQCWTYKKTQPFAVRTSLQTLPHTPFHTLRRGFKHTANVIG